MPTDGMDMETVLRAENERLKQENERLRGENNALRPMLSELQHKLAVAVKHLVPAEDEYPAHPTGPNTDRIQGHG